MANSGSHGPPSADRALNDRIARKALDSGHSTLPRTLAIAVVSVTLIPFLPLAWFLASGYRAEVRGVEREIESSNRHIARLAGGYLELLLRQVEDRARLAAETARAEIGLPRRPPEVSWELVAGDGKIIRSQLASRQAGQPCGYHTLVADLPLHQPRLTPVGRWLPDYPPTALLATRLDPLGQTLVAVFDPDALHSQLQAWSTVALDRHVYAVDTQGQLLFYSDLAVSQRGDDLRNNPPIQMLLEGREGPIRYRSTVSGKERLGFAHRLAGSDWGLVVSADVGSRLFEPRSRYLTLLGTLLFALAAAVAILAWTTRRVAGPLADIARALRSPTRRDHAPLEVRPASRVLAEYDDLVRAFDELNAELAAVERELVQAEKASLLGQLASGLAHEMGTPLNVITGNAQYLLWKTDPSDPARQVLERIVAQAQRIAAMIRRLLDLSRPARAELLATDLRSVVAHVLEVVPSLARDIDVRLDLDGVTAPVLVDPKLLEHALLNVVINACQAMPAGGRLSVVAGLASASPLPTTPRARPVCLQVVDTGCGIPADDLPRIFQPFFTTKPPSAGTGLGLAIVERIVRQLGGRTEVTSRPGHGTVFALFLCPAPSAGVEPHGEP